MIEVGLLIGFGVLLGELLLAMGALQRLVGVLLRLLGPQKLPYAFSAALSTIFPAIYVDVQLVLTAPLARSAAPRMSRDGLAMMSGTLTAGILVGYVFVVPGLGTVAIAGLLNVPLGTMLIFGTLIGLPTAVLTTFIYGRLLRYGLWDKDKDEVDFQEAEEESSAETEQHEEEQTENTPPLYVSLLPILVALLLIAFGAVAEAAGLKSPVVTFFGDPVFALFVGLLGAYLLAWRTLPNGRVGEAMNQGFDATGQILLITGLGGSLGAVITETGLQDILGGFFSAEAGTPDPADDPVGLVDRRRLAPCHRFDLGRRHHRSGHTGPHIGWPRSPRGDHGPGHRLRCVVRVTGKQQLLLDVPIAAGSLYPGSPQSPYPRNRAGLSNLPGPDPAAEPRDLTAQH